MLFYTTTALINAIASSVLGVFVYFKNKKAKTNRAFALFCLSATVWSYAYYFWQLSDNASDALFWSRGLMAGAVFITISYFYFVLRLLNKINEGKKILISGFLVFFFFFLTNFTPLFIKGVRPKLGFAFWPDAGILFHPFILIWFFYAFYAIYLLFRKYSVSTGARHNQIKYILLGTIVGYLGGATNYFLWYNIPVPPIGNWTTTFYLGIVAYAILKYRLMDIRVAIKRSTIFSGIVVVITATYTLAAFLLSGLVFGGVYTFKTQVITGLVVALLVAIGFKPFYDWLRRTTDTFLFKGEYRPQELMVDVSDVLSRTLDLDAVISTLKKQISKALRIEKMKVIVLEESGILRKGYQSEKKESSLQKIISYFKKEKQKETIVTEELKRKQDEKVKFEKSFLLIEEMEKLKIALVVPLFLKEKLVGLFLLSSKKSGDMFTNEDIKTLEGIASQATIAIENARLYEKMKDFSKTLQKEVDRQTKKLKTANKRLQTMADRLAIANDQLRKLDKAKSEFISIASHQLRTPLTAIKGFVSLILEGSYGKINSEAKDALNKVYLSNERLINLVEDLLNISRIESGRMEYNFEKIDLIDICKEIYDTFIIRAKEKHLKLELILPKKPFPKVLTDRNKIREVISNLVDNAIKYTPKGWVRIKLLKIDNNVQIRVTDTGIGISTEEIPSLFSKFSRGKDINRINATGTGLGLYVGKKMIEALYGKIWVESPGVNRGSTFFIEVPVKLAKKEIEERK